MDVCHSAPARLASSWLEEAAWRAREQYPLDQGYWPERLAVCLEDICVVHFSGSLKMWDRDYADLGSETDEVFAERLLKGDSPWHYKIWFERGGEAQDYEAVGWRPLGGSWEPVARPSPEAERHDAELGPHHVVAGERDLIEQALRQCPREAGRPQLKPERDPERADLAGNEVPGDMEEPREEAGFRPPGRAPPMDAWLDHLRSTARMATVAWRGDLLALPEQFPPLPPLPELLRRLREPAWPPDAAFSRHQRVDYWYRCREWFPAVVSAAHNDGTFSVEFETPGAWGTGAHHVLPDMLRHRLGDPATVWLPCGLL